MFSEAEAALLQSIIQKDLGTALWETLYMTFLPTILAFIIGLPLGILLVTGEENGIRPLPKALMKLLNVIINLLRSVPFLILLVVVLPISKLVVGTQVGSPAIVIPLAIAAFPFIARLVETSIREVDQGVVEAAEAMGATPFQIVWKVLIPEARPALVSNFMVALITIFGYGAMAGIVGGGGIGAIAINYGYYRRRQLVLFLAVVLLIVIVQVLQSIGNRITRKVDKRIR
jgi:D-methionine transport system permease protein